MSRQVVMPAEGLEPYGDFPFWRLRKELGKRYELRELQFDQRSDPVATRWRPKANGRE
jgi:hypothetical protein